MPSCLLLVVGALLVAAVPVPALAQAGPPQADLTVSGGMTLVSRYRFRGIDLSDEKPTIQGTLNLTHKSGAYAGFWTSGLDGFGELGGSNLELDLYAGYKAPIGKATLDAGLVYYVYPGAEGGPFDYLEPQANVSLPIGRATAKVGAAFAPPQTAIGGNSNLYLFNDNSLPLKGTPLTLTSHVGWSKGDTTLTPGAEYLDWSLGATARWRNLTAGVTYVDTNIGRRDALSAGATKTIVDSAVVLSLEASF